MTGKFFFIYFTSWALEGISQKARYSCTVGCYFAHQAVSRQFHTIGQSYTTHAALVKQIIDVCLNLHNTFHSTNLVCQIRCLAHVPIPSIPPQPLDTNKIQQPKSQQLLTHNQYQDTRPIPSKSNLACQSSINVDHRNCYEQKNGFVNVMHTYNFL